MVSQLPHIKVASERSSTGTDQVWLRISAFLSLKSSNTQRTYLGVIEEWVRFLGEEPGTSKGARKILSADDLIATAYINWLKGRKGQRPRGGISADKGRIRAVKRFEGALSKTNDGTLETLGNATIVKKVAALRRVYRVLVASSLGISANPFDSDRVTTPSARSGQKRPTEMLSFDKVKEIVDLPDIGTPKGVRDRAILSLLFGGGLRRGEVVKIRVGDVRKSNAGTVFVVLRQTKAKTDANQALPSWASKSIQELVKQRVQEGASKNDYLIISYRGPAGRYPTRYPLSDAGVYHLFKQYCLLAGVDAPVTPHSARATAITKLLTDGVDHRKVQEFSRHSSVQMVELYDKRRLSVDENPGKDLDY